MSQAYVDLNQVLAIHKCMFGNSSRDQTDLAAHRRWVVGLRL
jgi:hypothetical protein